MESTCEPDRIQISEATADILCAEGLSSRVTPRENCVEIKGKGVMQTYWLATAAASYDGTSDELSGGTAHERKEGCVENDETDIISLQRRMHSRLGRGSTVSSNSGD